MTHSQAPWIASALNLSGSSADLEWFFLLRNVYVAHAHGEPSVRLCDQSHNVAHLSKHFPMSLSQATLILPIQVEVVSLKPASLPEPLQLECHRDSRRQAAWLVGVQISRTHEDSMFSNWFEHSSNRLYPSEGVVGFRGVCSTGPVESFLTLDSSDCMQLVSSWSRNATRINIIIGFVVASSLHRFVFSCPGQTNYTEICSRPYREVCKWNHPCLSFQPQRPVPRSWHSAATGPKYSAFNKVFRSDQVEIDNQNSTSLLARYSEHIWIVETHTWICMLCIQIQYTITQLACWCHSMQCKKCSKRFYRFPTIFE